jgi:hypothetical protein
MSVPKKYMAAAIPRHVRQSRLAYLPLDCIIGSRVTRGDNDENLIFDIVMLPAKEFQRAKLYVGLQYEAAPALTPDSGFEPGYVVPNVKTVTVPAGETNPEAYARNHFMIEFDLIVPDPR